MSRRRRRRNKGKSRQQSGARSPPALTLLLAFAAIGGLNGVAEIISAVGSLIEAPSAPSGHCVKAGGGGGGR